MPVSAALPIDALPPGGFAAPALDSSLAPAPPPRVDWPTVLLPVHTATTGREPPSSGSVRAAGPGSPEPEPEPGYDAEETASPASRLPGPGAFDPGRRGVRALAVVAVLVVVGAAAWTWRSRPQVEPVVAVTGGASTPEPAAPDGDEPAAAPTGELVVAVAGKVRRPGLVRVPAGARVADAVEAAGGALPGVDVAMLNPARKVTDGELILVGVPAPTPPPGAPAVAGPGAVADPAAGGRVNLNTATAAQLETLPGVGPVLAQRIIEHRDRHGGFRSVSDLRQVNGIGDARYEQLKELVTV